MAPTTHTTIETSSISTTERFIATIRGIIESIVVRWGRAISIGLCFVPETNSRCMIRSGNYTHTRRFNSTLWRFETPNRQSPQFSESPSGSWHSIISFSTPYLQPFIRRPFCLLRGRTQSVTFCHPVDQTSCLVMTSCTNAKITNFVIRLTHD